MTDKFTKAANNYKDELKTRLENDQKIGIFPEINTDNVKYELSDKVSAVHCGGIGVINELVHNIGLVDLINEKIKLFKRHKPYHESDHVLNMAYNVICGGDCLEDIELLRNNIPYLNALGAERIPDPTTAGDFLRRFSEQDNFNLMDVINQVNQKIWKKKNLKKNTDAILDVDSTISGTTGECKEGMDMSYKGIWGFHPLVITEANTGTHLYLINRSGNAGSSLDAGVWIDKSIETVKDNFRNTYLRGDTAFSLTKKFDGWDSLNTKFVFGYSKEKSLVLKADSLPKHNWKRLKRNKTTSEKPRRKKDRIKEQVVKQRGYYNQRLKKEYVAEFSHSPNNCDKDYKIIVVKKILEITNGQGELFEDYKYFFYITNIHHMSPHEVVKFINGRCNHENKIEQLKNGIHSLKMPTAEFLANQAYMLIVSLAWNIKSWVGLLCSDKNKSKLIINMEFKKFQNCIINIPCQILTSGKSKIYRFLNYNPWVQFLYDTFNRFKILEI